MFLGRSRDGRKTEESGVNGSGESSADNHVVESACAAEKESHGFCSRNSDIQGEFIFKYVVATNTIANKTRKVTKWLH